jgi:Flp pilus assembly protein TadB
VKNPCPFHGRTAVTSIVDKEEWTDALVAEVRGALERKAIRTTLLSATPNGTLLRVAAVVFLPIGLGFGVVAMATSSPWWLLGNFSARQFSTAWVRVPCLYNAS